MSSRDMHRSVITSYSIHYTKLYDSPDAQGMREFNRLAAGDPRLVSALVPMRDGVVVAVKVAE